MVAVRKVRLGLVVMGVPSSSSRFGGWVMGWEAEVEVALAWTDDCVVRATLVLELEERAWKKDGGAVTLGGEVRCCVLWEQGLVLRPRLRLYGWQLRGCQVRCRQCSRVKWVSLVLWGEGKGREEE